MLPQVWALSIKKGAELIQSPTPRANSSLVLFLDYGAVFNLVEVGIEFLQDIGV